MSRFERQLRQDMADLARQLAPGDLRPLRTPTADRSALSPGALSLTRVEAPAWSSRRPGHWLGPVAAMAAIALIAGGLLAARNVLHARAADGSPAVAQVPADPAVVAVMGMSASGTADAIQVTSVRAGRTVRTYPIASDGTGLALAPDAKSLYVSGPAMRISRVTVATGVVRQLGTGAYPAVSPDSRTLAYASGRHFSAVAIQNLRNDRVRSISLAPLIGTRSSLLNPDGLTWLGNGNEVIAVPEPDPVAISGVVRPPVQDSAQGAERTACGQQISPHGLCVIVVDVRQRELHARKVFVPRLKLTGSVRAVSGDVTAGSSFVVALSAKGGDVVSEVTLGDPAVSVHRLARLPFQAVVVGIAPRADRVLYVPQISPIGLWIGAMRDGDLTDTRRLMTDLPGFELDQVSW